MYTRAMPKRESNRETDVVKAHQLANEATVKGKQTYSDFKQRGFTREESNMMRQLAIEDQLWWTDK